MAGADLRVEEVSEEDLGAREAIVRQGRGDRRHPESCGGSDGGHRAGEEEERQAPKETGQDEGGVKKGMKQRELWLNLQNKF